MSEQLWNTLNKLRGSQLSEPEEIAQFLEKEGIRFAQRDLATWRQFFAARYGRAASILPMGARASNPLKVATAAGENVELRDDLGNLVMVSASLHMRSTGVGLFVVTPSFFFSQRSVFRHLSVLGLGLEAALALPSGTFAPYTNIPA